MSRNMARPRKKSRDSKRPFVLSCLSIFTEFCMEEMLHNRFLHLSLIGFVEVFFLDIDLSISFEIQYDPNFTEIVHMKASQPCLQVKSRHFGQKERPVCAKYLLNISTLSMFHASPVIFIIKELNYCWYFSKAQS